MAVLLGTGVGVDKQDREIKYMEGEGGGGEEGGDTEEE